MKDRVRLSVDFGAYGYNVNVSLDALPDSIAQHIDSNVAEIIIKKEPAQNAPAGRTIKSCSAGIESDLHRLERRLRFAESFIKANAILTLTVLVLVVISIVT